MTVYVNGEEVTLHYANPQEGWGIVEFDEKDRLVDVEAVALKAENPDADIWGNCDSSREVIDALGASPEYYTPLDIRIHRYEVNVTTSEGDYIYSRHLDSNYKNTWEAVEKAKEMLLDVDEAHRTPARFVWRYRENLE